MSCFQAEPVLAIYGHARRAVETAAHIIKRAMEPAYEAGPASYAAKDGLSGAITASEREMLMACEVLLDIFEAM